MSTFLLLGPPFVVGPVAGGLIWWRFLKPRQDDGHERRRRAAGLPPKRHLPEDDA